MRGTQVVPAADNEGNGWQPGIVCVTDLLTGEREFPGVRVDIRSSICFSTSRPRQRGQAKGGSRFPQWEWSA